MCSGYIPIEYSLRGKNGFMFNDESIPDNTRTPILTFEPEAIQQTTRDLNTKYISYMVISDTHCGDIGVFNNTIRWLFALGRDNKIYYNVHGKGCGTTDYLNWDLYKLDFDDLGKYPESGMMIFGSNGYEYFGRYFTRRISNAKYNPDILRRMATFTPKQELLTLLTLRNVDEKPQVLQNTP